MQWVLPVSCAEQFASLYVRRFSSTQKRAATFCSRSESTLVVLWTVLSIDKEPQVFSLSSVMVPESPDNYFILDLIQPNCTSEGPADPKNKTHVRSPRQLTFSTRKTGRWIFFLWSNLSFHSSTSIRLFFAHNCNAYPYKWTPQQTHN